MYGEKPDTLKAPKQITKKGPGTKKEPEFIDKCTFNTGGDAKKARTDTKLAEPLVKAGNAKIASAPNEPEQPRLKTYEKSIENYADALRKDNYNADATLGLARAYDALRHKGCAIMLVKRLTELTTNAKYEPDARRAIAEVKAHSDWFAGYRAEVDRELP
jgi:hypothetical protein